MRTKEEQKQLEELSIFGLVITCKEVHPDVVTIVLTDGFSNNFAKTSKFIGKVTELFPDHPLMKTCITDENFAMIVLTKATPKN